MARVKGSLNAVSKVKQVIDAAQARTAIAKHLTGLTLRNNVNMAVFAAQASEEKAVAVLVEIMSDAGNPPAIRRACANDVITVARGAIRVWQHSGETISAQAPGEAPGTTVGQEIEAAKNTAALYEQFNLLVAQGVHSDDWPDDVRALVGDLVSHYNQVPVIINEQ